MCKCIGIKVAPRIHDYDRNYQTERLDQKTPNKLVVYVNETRSNFVFDENLRKESIFIGGMVSITVYEGFR